MHTSGGERNDDILILRCLLPDQSVLGLDDGGGSNGVGSQMSVGNLKHKYQSITVCFLSINKIQCCSNQTQWRVFLKLVF